MSSLTFQRVISQPDWVNDRAILQKKIYQILLKLLGDFVVDYTSQLLDNEAMENYWVKAFTHRSVDPQNNYEKLEFYGDKVLNATFAQYLRRRIGDELDQEKGTLLLNQYMSKKKQAELARNLGLPELVRFDPEVPDININIQEDVFESFAGALNNLIDDRVQPGLGYIFVFNILPALYDDVPIVLSEVEKDKKTLLKEIYEKMGWGDPTYVVEPSDNPKLGPTKVTVRSPTGDVLGVGYGPEKDAPFAAAKGATDKLAEQGITWESATRQKEERSRIRNPEYAKQERRMEEAIKLLNQQAKKQKTMPIAEYRIISGGTLQSREGRRHTFALSLGYQVGSKLQWRTLPTKGGLDGEQTKIDIMRDFADTHGVPANI